jgi:hypothetical protein
LQQFASPAHPTADGSDGPSQALGCLVVSQPFEIAKDRGSTKRIGQAHQFVVKNRRNVVEWSGLIEGGIDLDSGLFPNATPRRVGPCPDCHPMSDAAKPVAHTLAIADRARATDQHEKRRLKRILNVVFVTESAAANSQNHRSMPTDQSGESRLVRRGDEPLQKIPLAQARDGPFIKDAVKTLQNSPRMKSHHAQRLRSQLNSQVTPISAPIAVANLTFLMIYKKMR